MWQKRLKVVDGNKLANQLLLKIGSFSRIIQVHLMELQRALKVKKEGSDAV